MLAIRYTIVTVSRVPACWPLDIPDTVYQGYLLAGSRYQTLYIKNSCMLAIKNTRDTEYQGFSYTQVIRFNRHDTYIKGSCMLAIRYTIHCTYIKSPCML
jgi:hypothetical protein